MENYQQNLQEEIIYLEQTLAVIRKELDLEAASVTDKKSRLIALRKDMWENTVHFSNDFDRLPEINHFLSEVNNQTANYDSTLKQIKYYKSMLGSPYFGRFDFAEDSFDDGLKVYIGLHNVMDSKTHNIFVYDWRAPVSSIFYRWEVGKASYSAPAGIISGEVLLKRQYKIRDAKLKYFFDCSIRINDEKLQEVLGNNSSAKMRNIVETIQKEQDAIIRDTENELLMVQGVAGSGKTSIALHRIAFLLYEGLHANIGSNNIIIISPNTVFSKYISSVLPELGEENVEQTTFDDIVSTLFEGRLKAETRNEQLESLIVSRNNEEGKVRRQSIEFKGSRVFTQMLDRLIRQYERRMIAFEDVYFGGKTLFTRQQLKNLFLNDKIGMPMVKRLKRIEKKIIERVHLLRRKRLAKIEKIVEKSNEHELEIKSFSRLLSIKEAKIFMRRLRRYTEVDYLDLYKLLFNNQELFFKLARSLELPVDIEEIISRTKESLDEGKIYYEDCTPVLYLKIRLEGSDLFSEIKQVVIDEAQDYDPLQYEVFNLLFQGARCTVLGDTHQAVEKDADNSLYDIVADIFHRSKMVKLFLNKSYRASFEINNFTQRLLGKKQDFISFERHEAEPVIVFKDTPEMVERAVEHDIDSYFEQGYESIAVICKTREEAERLHARLNNSMNIKLVSTVDGEIGKGALVIPAYMVKGLEFDVVLVHGASRDNYATEFDRKLLYVACTRALHRLVLYHAGEKSPFI
ncbi:MAG: ATP-dependent DNA helicase [Peptococcaceae bacterium BRH_c4b]|nr:MAG: ATP-dependent DNA helicase [Peptococcaceae bacterium BRH_c4b]